MPSSHDKKKTMLEIGKKIREARQSRNLTQPDLAKLLGKSKQLVSSWEAGRAEITSTTLSDLAQKLGIDANWLLFGGNLSIRQLPEGSLVPFLTNDEVISFAQNKISPADLERRVYTYFKCEAEDFCFENPDEAMNSTLNKGELLVVSPNTKPQPGAIVAAVVFSDEGVRLEQPRLVVRDIHYSSSLLQAPYSLEPRRREYGSIRVRASKDATIVGILRMSIRNTFARASPL